MLTAQFKRLDLKPGDWVLDMGCGEGRHSHGVHMLGGINIVGLDLDLPSVQKARDGVFLLPERKVEEEAVTSFLVGNAFKLPFADNTFDALVCSEVLEHLPSYEDAIAEMRRVVKPEGRLCVTVPHRWPEVLCWKLAPPSRNGYPFQPGGHIRIFEDTDLRFQVERKGFSYKGKHHAHGLHSPYWWLKCAFWERRDDHPLIKAYHKFLVWDLMKRPWLSRTLDAIISPFMGKSLVLYFDGSEKR